MQSLRDNIEEFVHMAIQEFLTEKGFKRTLVAFQNEQQSVRFRLSAPRPRLLVTRVGLPAGCGAPGELHPTVERVVVQGIGLH